MVLRGKGRTVAFVHLVVIAATLLAAILRYYRLHTLPPAAWYDEVWFALHAREAIANGQFRPFYETSFGGANAGMVVLTALAQRIGFDLITGGRVMPALAGTLSVPLAYACFRELLGAERRAESVEAGSLASLLCWPDKRLAAALTALGLAYMLFYVTIGRIGMENGIAPAVALLVVWQMARAVNRRVLSGWLVAGLAAALAQYNGLHARFLLPLMAFLLIQDFIRADAAGRRYILFGAAVMGLIGVLVSLPLILFFIEKPQYFIGRASIVTQPMAAGIPSTYGEMLRYNARMIFRVFRIEGSYDPKNGIPGLPLLDWVQTPGFVIGLLWVVMRLPRSAFARTVLAWQIIMTLPSLLTEGAPNIGRMIGIAPPTAALIALGWTQIVAWVRPIGQRWVGHPAALPGRLVASVLGVLLILSSLGYHIHLLFVEWPKVPNLRKQFTAQPVDLARLLIERAEAGEAVLVSFIPEAEEDVAAFEWYFPGQPVLRMDFRKCLPLPHHNSTRANYLVLERDGETVGKLRALYPHSTIPLMKLDLWQTRATLVEIPPGALAPLPPQHPVARFGSGISLYGYDWSGPLIEPGRSLFITLYWQVSEPVGEALTAFTHIGTGLGDQLLIAQRDGQPCLGFHPTSNWIPGQVVPDSFAIIIPEDAPPGLYQVVVGWYSYPSLERLPLIEADDPLPDNRAVIGTLHVVEKGSLP